MNERQFPALDQLPPLETRRASLERLGDTVRGILSRTGMTEDELVDALTRDDCRPRAGDTDAGAKGMEATPRSE